VLFPTLPTITSSTSNEFRKALPPTIASSTSNALIVGDVGSLIHDYNKKKN